jgi:hypothetical protein
VVFGGCSAARLYAAAVVAATGLGYAITSQDPSATTLTFQTSMPGASWTGPDMTATVIAEQGAARIVVAGRRVRGYGLAFARWHQMKSIGLMFLDRVTAVLPSVAEPAPAPAKPRSKADDLQTLADLRARGVITEEEFQAQKKSLLSSPGT